MKPWWERFPGRLEYELDALTSEGIPYILDKDAQGKGFILLHLKVSVGDRELNLDVKFPVVYPYLRFEIFAPELDLKHHQNPFQKNLCLLGRSTGNWSTSDTVAKFIKDRLPLVIKAGDSDDVSAVKNIEEHQGEPISAYYIYGRDTIVLIDSSWTIDESVEKGYLEIGIDGPVAKGLRGALLAIKDKDRNAVIQAEQALSSLHQQRLEGRWIRHHEPIREQDPVSFFKKIITYNKRLEAPIWQNINGTKIDVIGLLFPEEVGWRESKDGWAFIIRVKEGHKSAGKCLISLARPGRAGRLDLRERIPELSGLSKKKIAVVGLGCLGAPSAIEFARCGVSELRILDFDIVEVGTSVRWPFGIKTAGKNKTDIIRDFINEHYPYTKVLPYPYRLGAVDFAENAKTDIDILQEFLDGIDLVYDATAEIGLEHLLSDLAAERGIPYIRLSTTPGAWGGLIARIMPAKTEGCWNCMMHALNDGSIPSPNLDPRGNVQPIGCTDPTFTGAGFDTGIITLGGVRLAISTLTSAIESGYPSFDWDVAVINLRDPAGKAIVPDWKTFNLKKHHYCSCGKKSRE